MEKQRIDKNIITFLSILNEGLYGVEGKDLDVQNVDWNYIYKTAVTNNLAGILYSAVVRRKDVDKTSASLLEKWKNETFKSTFVESKKYFAIRSILSEAKKEGIKLVFFKGCILADLYPQYVLRNSSDTDIFVYERDKEKAAKLLERLGYIKNEEHSKEQVLVYCKDELYHIIELHYCLWEDYQGKKIDTMSEMGLQKEESLIEIEACGVRLFTLGYEEHLIYQMFHIIKHFATEAVGLRYLVDITLYYNRYREHIDIESFWDKMYQLGYDKFCYTFFELCIQYLGMKDDILNGIKLVDENSKEKLLLDMINRGLLFEDKTASWQILGIMTPYLVGEETVPDSKLKRKLKVLFPSRKALPDKFAYARRHGILLPIAWLHKMIDFIIRYNKYSKINNDWYGANQKLITAEYRLNLMKSLGLVENKTIRR